MKYIKLLIVFASIFSLLNSCVTPFEPKGYDGADDLLVIEGDINADGVTEVILSRSLKLSDNSLKIEYVRGASVWIESEKGDRYYAQQNISPTETVYRTLHNVLDNTLQYKLCVNLPGGNSYESDLVPVLISPPILDIGFKRDTVKKSVTFHVSTEDPENRTKYYKWAYTEDWEFSAHNFAFYVYNPKTNRIDDLPYEDNTFFCWNKGKSKSILIASTSHLSQDKVHQMPLVSMGKTDDRISILYSIEVKQSAITREAYLYWENIRKNSDKVGGIFSPQPSEIFGNIKCLNDPSEVVLGYISAVHNSSMRFFATHDEMDTYSSFHNCEFITPETAEPPRDWLSMYQDGYLVISNDPMTRESIWSRAGCVDCRLKGTKNKPSFWPNDHK
ncbi:MAG: DUF4249 domain-containing protein [Bacteroidales bacterium]|jgi:hypothetical protein|nr:DUF4249 domain-containing protein [Bacteroidales bacterium]MDD3273484.1 DUF4249 domain-containing protein [Bacteroidales bacterium]MDD4058783.1 DUF4249 domain-containing protein [Bacteroidales bacterium]